jgi:hypothetical protein
MPECLYEAIEDLYSHDEELLFMRSFWDESGKQGWAPVLSIFGLLMSGRTCKELQRRWFKEAAKAPVIPLPFHMSDCVSGSKGFAYLKNDEPARVAMQERMIQTMRGLDMQVYGAAVIRADYEAVKEELRHDPKFRDPWFLAFETGIQEMMARSKEAGKNHRISLVFDRADEFKARALSLYDELLHLGVDRLGGLTFEAKDEIAALQAIDVIVYETNRFIADTMIHGLPQRRNSKLIGELLPAEGMVYEKQRLAALVDLVKRDRQGEL